MSFKGANKKVSNLHTSAEGYDLYAKLYDQSNGFLHSFENYELMRMFGEIKGKKVIDIGAGTGRTIRDLIDWGAEVTAFDVSEKMIEVCQKKFPKIETVVGDVNSMPFKDDTFDMAIALFMIVHVKYLTQAFDEIYRVLKDGGVFILSNINQRKAPKLKLLDGLQIVIESYYHRPDDVMKALEHSFFKVVEEKYVYEDGVWINQIIKVTK